MPKNANCTIALPDAVSEFEDDDEESEDETPEEDKLNEARQAAIDALGEAPDI